VALPFTIVLYEVLDLSSSGERFTIERDAPLVERHALRLYLLYFSLTALNLGHDHQRVL